MNIRQKIILLISSLLLLFGTLVFLFFPLIISSSFFLIYFGTVTLLGLMLILAFSKIKIDDEHIGKYDKSNQILFSAKSVFPFQLFPDKYFVQQKTISIVRKEFFSQGWIETISIKDLGGVRLYMGPLFASITIIRKILPQTSVELRNLWKKDGFKLKELLDGLIITQNKLVEMPEDISLKVEKKILFEIGRENEIEREI